MEAGGMARRSTHEFRADEVPRDQRVDRVTRSARLDAVTRVCGYPRT
jgi:hypothetical protein